VSALRAWIYRGSKVGGTAPIHFAPVRLGGGAVARATTPRGMVTVRWPQGIEVEIAVELDASGVGRLVRELLTPCLR